VFVCRALADGDGNREAQKEVQNIALDNNFAIPGDPGFPLNQVFPPFPSSLFLCLLHFFPSHFISLVGGRLTPADV
jgi:hypothetical protein